MKRFFGVAIALALASASSVVAAQEYGYRSGDRHDSRYDDRYDSRRDDRYDNRYGDRYDSRRDDRYDNRYGDRYDSRRDDRYDNRYGDRYDNRYGDRYDNRCDHRYGYRRDSAAPVFGAIVGGVIGNQFGHGRDRDVATVAGAALGYSIANNSSGRCDNSYRGSRSYYGDSYRQLRNDRHRSRY